MYQKYVAPVLLLALVVLGIWVASPILLSVFCGFLLAFVFYKPYRFFARRSKSNIAAAFVCVLVFFIFLIPLSLLLTLLLKESLAAFVHVKQIFAQGFFSGCTQALCERMEEFFSLPAVRENVQGLLKTITTFVIKEFSSLVLAVPHAILSLIVVFITMFYGLRDGKHFLEKGYALLGISRQTYLFMLGRLKSIVQGILFGYVFIAFIQGALGAFGFWIFGVPSPLFWGVIMGFLALIPYLGTGLVWGPAAILIALQGIFKGDTLLIMQGFGLFIYGFVCVSSVDNILRPKFISAKAGVHPLYIFVGIIGGVSVLGLVGVFIGPLIMSLLQVVVEVSQMER